MIVLYYALPIENGFEISIPAYVFFINHCHKINEIKNIVKIIILPNTNKKNVITKNIYVWIQPIK